MITDHRVREYMEAKAIFAQALTTITDEDLKQRAEDAPHMPWTAADRDAIAEEVERRAHLKKNPRPNHP